MKNCFVLVISFFILNITYAQKVDLSNFVLPVDFPIALSGNFSEPRATHFHSGIDIRTYVDGKKIYALEDGYVSRIFVSPYGYGMALYVDYQNGLRSVYGHLSAFATEIDNFTKNIQYKNKSFRIDEHLTPLDLPVKKGQVIAFSGNTGSSGGPHLHFEIRNAENDISINTIGNYIKINDITPPEANAIVVYPININSTINAKNDKQLFALNKINENSYTVKTPIRVNGKFALGVQYCDRITNSKGRFGAKSVSLYANSNLIYTANFSTVDFNMQANKNSCFDYELFVNNDIYVQKLFVEPNNNLAIYSNLVNSGYLNVENNEVIYIQVVITDFNDNSTIIDFNILADTVKSLYENTNKALAWNTLNVLEIEGFKAKIDSACLFYDQEIVLLRVGAKKYSPIFQLGNDGTAVKKKFKISISDTYVPKELHSKAFICRENKQKTTFLQTFHSETWLEAETNRCGNFYILIDTIAPKVTPINIQNDMSMAKFMDFKISDNLSGIKSYDIYINGEWILGEYEPKKKQLRYYFDSRLKKADSYKTKVIVTDNLENTSYYQFEFKRK